MAFEGFANGEVRTSMYRRLWCIGLAVLLIVVSPLLAHAQNAAGQPAARNLKDIKLTMFPGLPTCTVGSVVSGDPTKGASVIVAKLAAGCAIRGTGTQVMNN